MSVQGGLGGLRLYAVAEPWCAIRGVQGASDSLWVVAQVRNRKARQAVSSLKQPMLQSAYAEPPVWTLPKLLRSAVITLVSGAIAGEAFKGREAVLPCSL